MSNPNNRLIAVTNALDEVGPGFCLAKWQQVTLHLHSGQTHSCHHPAAHKIPVEELEDNPSALHNTKFKKKQRKTMLEGGRPSECDYCWRVEDNNDDSFSDRTYKSQEPWALPHLNEIKSMPWDHDVVPSYLEISFSSVCNFKCSYCGPQFSSKWMDEIQHHGAYNTSVPFNSLYPMQRDGTVPIPVREYNPYVDAFWKWWPEISDKLNHFRITGGEPLLSKDTFKMLDYIIENPLPEVEFSINSNMCIPDELFEKFLSKVKIICDNKLVKKFKVFTSAEAYGAQAEYIRHGLDYDKWLFNIRRVLTEVPECTFTCMCTYNLLSMMSFDKFLEDILSIKQEFGSSRRGIPIILDVPYLRYPQHQAIKIAPPGWNSKYITKQLEFIRNNLEDPSDPAKANYGFYSFEADKFQRLQEVFSNENLSQEELDTLRRDFVIFVDEHDRRRGTDFLATFPEMEDVYHEWKSLLNA
jgi:organic radical activating enzyme